MARDGREPGARASHHARGAGRLRAAQPEGARTRPTDAGKLRRGDRPGRDQVRGRATTLVAEDDHRRPETTPRGPGGAADPLSARTVRHRGERERDRGRRGGGRGHRPAKPPSRRSAGRSGGSSRWDVVGVEPRIMGIGPVPAIRARAREVGARARRHRSLRDQRGVRRAVPRGREDARARPRAR